MNDQRFDLPEIESVVGNLVNDLGQFQSANRTLNGAANRIEAMLEEVAALNQQFSAIEPSIQSAITQVSSLNLNALRTDLAATDQRILQLSSDLDVLRVSIAELRHITAVNEKHLESVSRRLVAHQHEILSTLSTQYDGIETLLHHQQNELNTTLRRQDQELQTRVNQLHEKGLNAQAQHTRITITVSAFLSLLLALLVLIQ